MIGGGDMTVLKTIVTIMSAMLILIILFFSKDFRWRNDKASIIGFGYMVITISMSTALMWI